jgi:hypothetical protein
MEDSRLLENRLPLPRGLARYSGSKQIFTYMAMEDHFHQQVCPNINKNTQIAKMHVENFQGRHFCQNKKPRATTSHRACKVDHFPIMWYYW